MQILGLLYLGKGLLKLNQEETHSPLYIARLVLKREMKSEGFKFNPKTRIEWLQEFVDTMNENAENDGEDSNFTIENSVDYIVDHVLHSNAPHIIGMDRAQVSSDYVNECAIELVRMLETELEHVKKESHG